MKLERITAMAMTLAAFGLVGCASAAPPPSAPVVAATDVVSTTALTSATESEPDLQGAPRVGKSQRALDAASQDALDPKRSPSREGKHTRSAFADWK